jgi:hypothetical protein
MSSQWVIHTWGDESGEGKDLYEVEYAGMDKVIVKGSGGKFHSMYYSEVDFISEEQAMLWILENQ